MREMETEGENKKSEDEDREDTIASPTTTEAKTLTAQEWVDLAVAVREIFVKLGLIV